MKQIALGSGGLIVPKLGLGCMGMSEFYGPTDAREDLDSSDYRLNSPRFSEENLDKNLALAKHVIELADAKQVTPAQLALGWVLSRGDDIVAIPGTRRPQHLRENVGALQVTFSDEELKTIDGFFPVGVAAGTRY